MFTIPSCSRSHPPLADPNDETTNQIISTWAFPTYFHSSQWIKKQTVEENKENVYWDVEQSVRLAGRVFGANHGFTFIVAGLQSQSGDAMVFLLWVLFFQSIMDSCNFWHSLTDRDGDRYRLASVFSIDRNKKTRRSQDSWTSQGEYKKKGTD